MSAHVGVVKQNPDAMRAVLALVQPGLARVEASLSALAMTDDPILEPMLSAVLPGSGKRLRPALALVIGRMAGAGSGAAAQPGSTRSSRPSSDSRARVRSCLPGTGSR